MKVASSKKGSVLINDTDPIKALLSSSIESPLKTKSFFKRDSISQHHNKYFQVILMYKNQRHQYNMEYADRTCADLYNYLKQKIFEIDVHNNFHSEGGGTGSTENDKIG